MASLTITREKALKWRNHWGQGDLRVIDQELSRVAAIRFTTVGNQYVSCRTQGGRVACRVYPGYIEFTREFAPHDLPEGSRWRILSTFQRRGEGEPTRVENVESCPQCWMRLPLSGICDCQD